MSLKETAISICVVTLCQFSFAQTYPNIQNRNQNQSPLPNYTIGNGTGTGTGTGTGNTNNNAQKLQPNVIVTFPINSSGAMGSTNNQNTGLAASKKLQAERPVNPGYDTTSSAGGPSNNQGSITYSSTGSIKTQTPH